eukprot:scaffold44043_cov36-Phaeocystis_antarctica.AAC.2
MPRHLPGPSVAGSGSSTQSRPASLLHAINGGWLRCSKCWPTSRERRNPAGAQLNAEAVEVNQDPHVHAVGRGGATGWTATSGSKSAAGTAARAAVRDHRPMIDALLLLFMASMVALLLLLLGWHR